MNKSVVFSANQTPRQFVWFTRWNFGRLCRWCECFAVVNRNPSVIASLLSHVILFADSESGHSRTDEEAYRLKIHMFFTFSQQVQLRLYKTIGWVCRWNSLYRRGSYTTYHKIFTVLHEMQTRS